MTSVDLFAMYEQAVADEKHAVAEDDDVDVDSSMAAVYAAFSASRPVLAPVPPVAVISSMDNDVDAEVMAVLRAVVPGPPPLLSPVLSIASPVASDDVVIDAEVEDVLRVATIGPPPLLSPVPSIASPVDLSF